MFLKEKEVIFMQVFTDRAGRQVIVPTTKAEIKRMEKDRLKQLLLAQEEKDERLARESAEEGNSFTIGDFVKPRKPWLDVYDDEEDDDDFDQLDYELSVGHYGDLPPGTIIGRKKEEE